MDAIVAFCTIVGFVIHFEWKLISVSSSFESWLSVKQPADANAGEFVYFSEYTFPILLLEDDSLLVYRAVYYSKVVSRFGGGYCRHLQGD